MRLDPGTSIGPYEIQAAVGTGGMGEVYRAHDPRLGRDVALKVLRHQRASQPGAVARFEREARAVAALSHPNVLAIYDVGSDGGVSYVVTELLEGETLRERLERSRLEWRQAVEIASAVAEGVGAAHARGLVHRDIKPENVFLTTDGRAKILDFGLAAIREDSALGSASDAPTVTRDGAILGTVGYMSPEQVRGETAGAPSDIFSIGCVLYEMVTGRKAFRRETAVQTMSAILEEEPTPPSREGTRTPVALDEILSRCLAKSSEERFQSAADLNGVLADLTRDDGAPNVMSSPATKNRGRVLTALGLVVALLVIATALLRLRGDGDPGETRIESLAVLPLENLSGDPGQDFFADGITEALITNLGSVSELRVIARPAVMQYRGTRKPLSEIAEELGVQALVSGSVVRNGDLVQIGVQLIDPGTSRNLWSRSFERPLAELGALQRDLTQALAEEVGGRLDPDGEARLAKTTSADPEAYEAYLRAIYALGTGTRDEESRSAIELLQRAIELDPGFGRAHATLATAYVKRRTGVAPEEAEVLEPLAFAAVERALALDPDLAEAYVARGDLLWTPSHRFAHERAVHEYRRALELSPNLDTAHTGLASIFAHVGFFEEALGHADRALASNPSNGLAVHHRSEALLWKGNNEEALLVLTKIPRPVWPGLVAAHEAWALSRLGRLSEARAALDEAIRDFPDDPSGVLPALDALSVSATAPELARERIEHASRRGGFNPSHHTNYFIGSAWARMGEPSEAVRWLRRAAENGFPCLPLLESDPNLDPIRDDPGFRSHVDEVRRQATSLSRALFPDGR